MMNFSYDPDSKRIKNREALIRYRKSLKTGGTAEDGVPQGSGPLNRDGNPKLPPGQREVEKWPVLDLGTQPEIPLEMWSLTISGLVDRPKSFTWEEFMALPQIEDVSDFHCVTTWSKMDNHWKGVQLKKLAEICGVQAEAKYIFVKAYDSYTTNLPIEEALKPDVLLVHSWENQPLTKEHGGPVRMITPQLYAWKGAKWIGEVCFRDRDELGFWEQRGYSNSAEPWLNDRYS